MTAAFSTSPNGKSGTHVTLNSSLPTTQTSSPVYCWLSWI